MTDLISYGLVYLSLTKFPERYHDMYQQNIVLDNSLFSDCTDTARVSNKQVTDNTI